MRISDWSSDVCSSDLPPPHCRTRGACSPGRKHAVSLSLAKARDVLMGALFADTAAAEKPRARFGLDMLSDWLPYRVFDESAGLYRNARSKGSILQGTPPIGADEGTGSNPGPGSVDRLVGK